MSNNSGIGGIPLAPREARILRDYRDQLGYWWETLQPEQRDFLIAHRDDELPSEYARTVMSASGAHHTGASLLAVAIAQDTRTGLFRLPRMVHVYVDLHARLRDGVEPSFD